MRYSLLAIIAFAAVTSACDAPARHAVAATGATTKSSAVSVPNTNGVIPGTPEGDLDRWVKEIRKGIAEVPALMKSDPAAAQRTTMDLYVTRQEYSEMYYGKDGRQRVSDELAFAISEAEQRFHELMKLVAVKNPSSDDVKTAVNALDKQQARVAKLWKKTGAHINRPAK